MALFEITGTGNGAGAASFELARAAEARGLSIEECDEGSGATFVYRRRVVVIGAPGGQAESGDERHQRSHAGRQRPGATQRSRPALGPGRRAPGRPSGAHLVAEIPA